MGALLDLCHQLGGIVKAKVDRAMTDWMFAVSGALDATGASLPLFNTIAAGAAGSGRLIDLTLGQIAGLSSGAEVWVASVRSDFIWNATSTATADNSSIVNPTANGANPGRFFRSPYSDASWQQQTTWFIDPANAAASDENSGLVAGAPLKTGKELARRMGPSPVWNAGDYHIRVISDLGVGADDFLALDGTMSNVPGTVTASKIFVHGSATDGQGQSILFGPANVDVLVALTRTATPMRSWEVTCNAIPVSWTASGLISDLGTTSPRVRMTAGTNPGAIAWTIADLGAKACKFSAFVQGQAPFSGASQLTFSNKTIAANDTFVIEKLTRIDKVRIGIRSTAWSSAPTQFLSGVTQATPNIVFDSLEVGINEMTVDTMDLVQFVGCWGTAANSAYQRARTMFLGCAFHQLIYLSGNVLSGFYGGWSSHEFLIAGQAEFGLDFMFQGNATAALYCTQNGYINVLAVNGVGGLALFNCQLLAGAIVIDQGGTLAMNSSSARIWGDTNAVGMNLQPGAKFLYKGTITTTVRLTGTTNDFQVNAVASARGFDNTQGAGATYTALRTTSWANVAATIGGGGFGGSINDPATQVLVAPN